MERKNQTTTLPLKMTQVSQKHRPVAKRLNAGEKIKEVASESYPRTLSYHWVTKDGISEELVDHKTIEYLLNKFPGLEGDIIELSEVGIKSAMAWIAWYKQSGSELPEYLRKYEQVGQPEEKDSGILPLKMTEVSYSYRPVAKKLNRGFSIYQLKDGSYHLMEDFFAGPDGPALSSTVVDYFLRRFPELEGHSIHLNKDAVSEYADATPKGKYEEPETPVEVTANAIAIAESGRKKKRIVEELRDKEGLNISQIVDLTGFNRKYVREVYQGWQDVFYHVVDKDGYRFRVAYKGIGVDSRRLAKLNKAINDYYSKNKDTLRPGPDKVLLAAIKKRMKASSYYLSARVVKTA